VAGRDNARLRRERDAEVLALEIYRQADGEVITRRTVESTLARWREHSEGCRCPAPCELAAGVGVSRVWCVCWGWQASIARTRRLARR
jgi:hypothetical protein